MSSNLLVALSVNFLFGIHSSFSFMEAESLCAQQQGTYSQASGTCFGTLTSVFESAEKSSEACISSLEKALAPFSVILDSMGITVRARLAQIPNQAVFKDLQEKLEGRLGIKALSSGSSDMENNWCWVDGFDNPTKKVSWLPSGGIQGRGDCLSLQGSSFVRVSCEAVPGVHETHLGPLCEVLINTAIPERNTACVPSVEEQHPDSTTESSTASTVPTTTKRFTTTEKKSSTQQHTTTITTTAATISATTTATTTSTATTTTTTTTAETTTSLSLFEEQHTTTERFTPGSVLSTQLLRTDRKEPSTQQSTTITTDTIITKRLQKTTQPTTVSTASSLSVEEQYPTNHRFTTSTGPSTQPLRTTKKPSTQQPTTTAMTTTIRVTTLGTTAQLIRGSTNGLPTTTITQEKTTRKVKEQITAKQILTRSSPVDDLRSGESLPTTSAQNPFTELFTSTGELAAQPLTIRTGKGFTTDPITTKRLQKTTQPTAVLTASSLSVDEQYPTNQRSTTSTGPSTQPLRTTKKPSTQQPTTTAVTTTIPVTTLGTTTAQLIRGSTTRLPTTTSTQEKTTRKVKEQITAKQILTRSSPVGDLKSGESLPTTPAQNPFTELLTSTGELAAQPLTTRTGKVFTTDPITSEMHQLITSTIHDEDKSASSEGGSGGDTRSRVRGSVETKIRAGNAGVIRYYGKRNKNIKKDCSGKVDGKVKMFGSCISVWAMFTIVALGIVLISILIVFIYYVYKYII